MSQSYTKKTSANLCVTIYSYITKLHKDFAKLRKEKLSESLRYNTVISQSYTKISQSCAKKKLCESLRILCVTIQLYRKVTQRKPLRISALQQQQ